VTCVEMQRDKAYTAKARRVASMLILKSEEAPNSAPK